MTLVEFTNDAKATVLVNVDLVASVCALAPGVTVVVVGLDRITIPMKMDEVVATLLRE